MGLLDGTTQQDYYNGSDHGNYQFTSLDDVINQFIVAYVGEDKIISKIKRVDVAFHAQRAMQELSFDTFKSCKSQEITVPASLQMTLPQDYVNYTRVLWVDSAGIKHPIYPTKHTQNPTNPYQNSNEESETIFEYTVNASIYGNKNIFLDGIHDDIAIGTQVTGPTIGDWHVFKNTRKTGTNSGNTVIQLVQSSPNPSTIPVHLNEVYFRFDADNPITETLTITQMNGANNTSLHKRYSGFFAPEITDSAFVLSNGIGPNNVIRFDNASDTSDIKVGMIFNYQDSLSNQSFPLGTIVTGINGKYITLSNDAVQVVTPSTSGIPTGEILFISEDLDSDTWSNYKSATPSENQNQYDDDTYWPANGERYGLDPQHAQANGSFYIDCISGKIHFSSNISGKTVILDYISDSLGTDEEMQVHKFAEEAIYKHIAYAILSTRANVQEYIVQRFKKERFAETRKAKLRLSNIKLEEITQILRGKSKQIKH